MKCLFVVKLFPLHPFIPMFVDSPLAKKSFFKKLNIFSVPGENRGERLGEFESRSVKTRDIVEGFTCSRIFTNFAENFTRLLRHGKHVLFLF